MTNYLALGFVLATIAGPPLHGAGSALPDIGASLVKTGLTLDGSGISPAEATPDPSTSCAHVSFSRNLKYGESDLNVLDIATGDAKDTSQRPVLLFVVGESFAGNHGAPDVSGALQDQAMCFAAGNGMVGVKVTYRLAPANPWPAGAKDVAAAISWVNQNIDLFGGNRDEIVPVGYAVGAFHVASLLAHPELQDSDSDIAGAVLVSGLYRPSADASADEKSYLGADTSKYAERSALPGILKLEIPMVLAWSAADPPRLVAQGEKLRELLCNSPAQCPHTTVLRGQEGLASLFEPDAPGEGLAEPIRELVREIEARGLP
jgi:acetyl esterase/lipase